MKKTESINLGGHSFIINSDAYEYMEKYLTQIENHFRNTEGKDNIMDDIENRMAELLNEALKGKAIVTMSEVKTAVSILGLPEEFEVPDDFESEPQKSIGIKPGKKLYRDPDDKIIGGVCSGLAAYLGIQDPLWVRIGFAIVTFSFGAGVALYLLFWALVPEAKTPSDFLAMKGEPININNIAKTVEKQVEQISDQISDLGNEWKNKRKERRKKKQSK